MGKKIFVLIVCKIPYPHLPSQIFMQKVSVITNDTIAMIEILKMQNKAKLVVPVTHSNHNGYILIILVE